MSNPKSSRDLNLRDPGWWSQPLTVRQALAYTLPLVGLLVAIMLALETYWANNSAHWPSTAGEITVSQPIFTYTYYVNDQRYDSRRISYGQGTIPTEMRPNIAGLLPVGTKVTVYFDPEEPWSSVLFPGSGYTFSYYLFATLGLLFAYSIFITAIMTYMRRKGGYD